MNRKTNTDKKKDKGYPENIKELALEYRHQIEKFQSMNTNNAYDTILDYLIEELAKLDQQIAKKNKVER